MILEAKNLSKSFDRGRVRAVQELSFGLECGKTLGIVGESGCGKSTLAKLILRLLAPDTGEIYFEGQAIERSKEKNLRDFRKKAQIIFQHPFLSLDPRRTAGESIQEALLLQGVERRFWGEKTTELLRRVGLGEDLRGRYPRELSGGECQRVAIARAISGDPRLLVCDEATASLDRPAQARILNLLLGLQSEKHLAMVFISHDLRTVRHMSDDVLVMRDGKICESGLRDEVFNDPKHPYTRELMRGKIKTL